MPQFWNGDPGSPVSVSVSVLITKQRFFYKNLNAYLRVTITYLKTSNWTPTHCKTSATFLNINLRTSSYVTIVCRRSVIQGRAQINDFGYLVRRHFDTETSKSEPGTTYSRYRYRWNRWSFMCHIHAESAHHTEQQLIRYTSVYPHSLFWLCSTSQRSFASFTKSILFLQKVNWAWIVTRTTDSYDIIIVCTVTTCTPQCTRPGLHVYNIIHCSEAFREIKQ